MKEILKVNKVSAGYGDNVVLHDVSFSLNNNEFLGILGPNGSGKTTLLKVLSRVLIPSKGEVLLENKNIFESTPRAVARRVSFVSQDTIVNFAFTVWEIVLMGRIPFIGRLRLETKKDFNITQDALRVTNALELRNRSIFELSAGERQRVFIAKALAQEPTLLFLDEPTAHLDISYKIEILNLIKRLNEASGLSVIVVLHDLNLASEYCDRIILLKDGRIFHDAGPQEVLTKKNIDQVYDTDVILEKNPVSSKPLILLPRGRGKE